MHEKLCCCINVHLYVQRGSALAHIVVIWLYTGAPSEVAAGLLKQGLCCSMCWCIDPMLTSGGCDGECHQWWHELFELQLKLERVNVHDLCWH